MSGGWLYAHVFPSSGEPGHHVLRLESGRVGYGFQCNMARREDVRGELSNSGQNATEEFDHVTVISTTNRAPTLLRWSLGIWNDEERA